MLLNFAILRELTPRQRLTHRLDMGAALFYGITIALLRAMPGYIQNVLGGGPLAVTLLRSLEYGAQLLSVYWAGFIRHQPKVRWVVRSYAIGACTLLALALWPSVPTALVALTFFYTMVTSATPALNSIYKENYPDASRFQLLANMRILTAFSLAGGGYLMSRYLGEGEGTPQRLAHLLVVAGCAALGVTAFYRMIRLKSDGILLRRERSGHAAAHVGAPPPPVTGNGASPTRAFEALHDMTWRRYIRGFEKLRTDRLFRRFMIAYFFFGWGAQGFEPVMDVYLRRELAATNAQIGLIYTTIPFLVSALVMRWSARLLDRLDPIRGRALFTALWMITPLLAAISTFCPRDTALILIYASRLAYGVSFAGSTLLWTLSVTYFARDAHEAVQYMGVHASLTGLRGLLAPFVGYVLMEWCGIGFVWHFGGAVVLMGISVWMTWRLAREWPHRRGGPPEAAKNSASGAGEVMRNPSPRVA